MGTGGRDRHSVVLGAVDAVDLVVLVSAAHLTAVALGLHVARGVVRPQWPPAMTALQVVDAHAFPDGLDGLRCRCWLILEDRHMSKRDTLRVLCYPSWAPFTRF